MSERDPFFLVKSEIENVVKEVEARYEGEWDRALSESPESEECYRIGEEILQKVKDIEWEMQDVIESVTTLEKNSASFNIDSSEIKSRKDFIQGINARLTKIKTSISSAHNTTAILRNDKPEEEGLDKPTERGKEEMPRNNSHKTGYSDSYNSGMEQSLSALTIEQENEGLDLLQDNVKKLGVMGLEITSRLDTNNVQMEDLSDRVDQTNSDTSGAKEKIRQIVGKNRRDRILSVIVCVLVLVLVCIIIASIVSKKKKK